MSICNLCGNEKERYHLQKNHHNTQNPKTRRKISLALKGRKLSKEHILKMSESRNGHIVSIETRRKIGIANRGKKHSIESRKRMSEAKIGGIPWNKGKPHFKIRGENHPQWKGGVSKGRRGEGYFNLQYKKWRTSVFERDDHTCQECKKRGCYLESHHIKSWKDYPLLRLDVDNGITYCRPCHIKKDGNRRGKSSY
ncbi:HNH endonuclease [candidate division TA06 bacterium]|nr:HNH endonuclease [candidate division TA06 bacterium]